MPVLTRGERFKGARLDHNQHGKQTMDEVSAATGVGKSLIHALEDDENDRSVGYDKVAKLALHYGVSANWLLCLSDDPYITASAADDLRLSADAVKIIKNRLALTNFGDECMEGLNSLIEKGYFLDIAWRVKDFCEQVREYVSLMAEYETAKDDSIILDSFKILDDIESTISSTYPKYQGKYRIFTGYRFIAAEKREIVDEFEKCIESISEYNRLLEILPHRGSWL